MRNIADFISDITENSFNAGASKVKITVCSDTKKKKLFLKFYDNGRGMTKEQMDEVFSPFSTTRTTRKVGMGLSFLKQAVELTGGLVKISSSPQRGTALFAEFNTDSVDMPPEGDIGEAAKLIMSSADEKEHLIFKGVKDGERIFYVSANQLRKELEDVPINHPEVLNYIKKQITAGGKFYEDS